MEKVSKIAFRSGAYILSLLAKMEQGTLSQRLEMAKGFMETLGRHKKTTVLPVGRQVRYNVPGEAPANYNAFHTCNYLGFSMERRLWQAASRAALEYGCGASTSPFGAGRTELQKQVEAALASFLGVENAIVFSSGFSANMGVLIAVASRNDVLFLDSLLHTSFLEGVKCTHGKPVWFKHNDVADLEAALNEHQTSSTKFVVVEAVYSMEADAAPLKEILRLCETYDCIPIVDECHSLGTMGAWGRGLYEAIGEKPRGIITGTFSKAIPVTGGYVAGDHDLIEYIRLKATPYNFSASCLTPADAAAILESLVILQESNERVATLQKNVRLLHQELHTLKAVTVGGIISVPVPARLCDTIEKSMADAGYLVPFITYPGVPMGQERLRILVSALHTEADLLGLAACLKDIFRRGEV